jgi:membrane protease YdiL (CAAX protease family)
MKRHILIGAGAAFLLLLVYIGIITLAQGLDHALDQTYDLWYWVAALTGGFGIQAGLFSFVRHGLNQRRSAATASVTASGGVSAGSMVACCAHHLTDILPFLGMAGLAAFLSNYQVFFLTAGVLSNVVGITIMLEAIQRHGLSQKLAARQWNMNLVKRGSMVSSGLILVATFFVNFLTSGGM